MRVDDSIKKMKNLVDISTMITQSIDFFSIKDKVIEKMLEVVHPTKACINLFYDNCYEDAYLVCSQTLDVIPKLYDNNCKKIGTKIKFDDYSSYIHEAVNEKKIVYIQNIYEDKRALTEIPIAKKEGYIGRVVFPLVFNYNVIGFMTCFLDEDDFLSEEDIDFISSVTSLISLSIDITNKNNNTSILINKLRNAILSINEATKKLYFNKDISEFLNHLCKEACSITNSKESLILIEKFNYEKKMLSFYSKDKENQSNIYQIMEKIKNDSKEGYFSNNVSFENIDSLVYHKLNESNDVTGYIVCANSKNYTDDDLNILSILIKQIHVAMKLFKYNLEEINHKILANELELLNSQQKLLMDSSTIKQIKNKEINFYHKPAKVVGGDFYYSVRVDEENIIYIVADVMGHGMVSNYVVAIIKGAFKVLSKVFKTPGEIMTNMNSMLYDEFDKMGVFTTSLIAMINSKTNEILISNSGHYNPIIIDKYKNIKRDLVIKKGVPIGVIENAKYETNVFTLDDILSIWMYTDGILEVRNDKKEEFGIERFEEFILENLNSNYEDTVKNIEDRLREFSKKDTYEDDILAVMLKNLDVCEEI